MKKFLYIIKNIWISNGTHETLQILKCNKQLQRTARGGFQPKPPSTLLAVGGP
jgi:hypothetical protein